jgi:hypothetical protein
MSVTSSFNVYQWRPKGPKKTAFCPTPSTNIVLTTNNVIIYNNVIYNNAEKAEFFIFQFYFIDYQLFNIFEQFFFAFLWKSYCILENIN